MNHTEFKNSTLAAKRDVSDAKITWAIAVPLIIGCIYIAYRAMGG
jgi:hypothetical protein